MTASLRIQSSKADSNTWESVTRSGLKLESVHQESPRSDVFRKRATKPLLNQIKSNQITFIVTSSQHMCLDEWNSWERAPYSAETINSDESVASPLIISISPSLIRRPSPGSRREWVCERGGALKQPGLAACDEAHTWSEWSLITAAVICRVRLSSGDRSLPRACTLVSSWVQEGSVERRGPHPLHGWRARMPGRIIPGGAVGRRRMKPLQEAATPRAPDPRGERLRPPDSAPYLDPSFQNTAPPSQPAQHDEDTRSPVYFGHFIPFGHFVLLFLLNKSLSEAWRHAHCVCRLLLPPHNI